MVWLKMIFGELIYTRCVPKLIYLWTLVWDKNQTTFVVEYFPCYFTWRPSMETTPPAESWFPCWMPRKHWKYSTAMWFCFNSLAPGKFEWNFRYLIFQMISVIDGWSISCELALRWMSLDLTDDKSTLVQVMASCRQATSHYLNQFWPKSLSPYGVTRPQWVNIPHDPWHPHGQPGGCLQCFNSLSLGRFE